MKNKENMRLVLHYPVEMHRRMALVEATGHRAESKEG
jgi:hypothetical protein